MNISHHLISPRKKENVKHNPLSSSSPFLKISDWLTVNREMLKQQSIAVGDIDTIANAIDKQKVRRMWKSSTGNCWPLKTWQTFSFHNFHSNDFQSFFQDTNPVHCWINFTWKIFWKPNCFQNLQISRFSLIKLFKFHLRISTWTFEIQSFSTTFQQSLQSIFKHFHRREKFLVTLNPTFSSPFPQSLNLSHNLNPEQREVQELIDFSSTWTLPLFSFNPLNPLLCSTLALQSRTTIEAWIKHEPLT